VSDLKGVRYRSSADPGHSRPATASRLAAILEKKKEKS